MEIESTESHFYFATNQHGTQSTVSFDTEYWPVALAQFIKFMRGAGYSIDQDNILIVKDGLAISAEEYAQDFE